jgi:23S rRNA (adenine-N6)-dimethyltransferase
VAIFACPDQFDRPEFLNTMPTYHSGRHEYGQNFLTDRTIIDDVIALVDDTDGPIIEIGPGAGALTRPLARLQRPLTGVEIDPKQVKRLAGKLPDTTLITGDFLAYRLPSHPHVVVGNLPFHITTAVLRKLLHAPGWTRAVLVVQWEVARRRAGIGGATMMTAQWWPWYTFAVHGRIPGSAFTPSPGVDAGLMSVDRRTAPLLPREAGSAYRAFVHAVFTGRGRGLHDIVGRVLGGKKASSSLQGWLRTENLRPAALPRDLTAEQWVSLFRTAERTGWRPRR